MNKLILLGTGCPSPSHLRYGPSSLVSYEGTNYLIDAGSGVTQRLSEAGIKPGEIDYFFITHLHSDHIVDLYQLFISGWHTGRETKFKVFGPKGLKSHFDKIFEAYKEELDLRKEWEKRPNVEGLAYEITEINNELKIELDSATIESVKVDHHPVDPAFGYKFILGPKNIIFSGDTRYCEVLEKSSKDADILVHEVFVGLDYDPVRMSSDTIENISDYHTTPEEIGVLASNASVKKLILNHFVPPVFDEDVLVERIAKHFDGEIVVGKDLMQFDI
jgi:ribonuclease Z